MSKETIKHLADQAHHALCLNDFSSALNLYNKILTIDPEDDSALHFVGIVLNLQGKHKTALELVKRAINRYKCSSSYYTSLANIYRNLGDYTSAVDAIRTACELKPRDAICLSNAAMILADERRYDRAKEVYEFALDIEPENAFVHFNYSLLLLSLGEFEKGWQEYEWRIPFHYGIPRTTPPKDLKGKKVYIIPEQGYGDFIMFSRYFKLLEEAGAQVYVSCPKALERLYDPHYCPQPDLTIHVTSLASLFNTIPNQPYIKAPGLKKIKGNYFKVGVASRAVKPFNNDVHVVSKPDGVQIIPHPSNLAYLSTFKRSLPQDFFDPMLHKVQFFNLQIDVTHYGMENINSKDFGDLADYVDQMDLIITIDTALAHLAGAMGKKTWLLLPYDFEWRWQVDKKDSPWYPSINIFRQPVRGDWQSVQDEVASQLGLSLKSTPG